MACSTADKNKAIKEASKVLFNDLKEQYPDASAKELTKQATEQAKKLLQEVISTPAEYQKKSNIPFSSKTKRLYETLEDLSVKYPAINVEFIRDITDSGGGPVIGRAIGRTVEIDPDKAGADTIPHEYAHVYINMLEFDNGLITTTLQDIKSNYNMSREEAKELLSHRIGELYVLDDGSITGKEKSLIKKIWWHIKAFFAPGLATKEADRDLIDTDIVRIARDFKTGKYKDAFNDKALGIDQTYFNGGTNPLTQYSDPKAPVETNPKEDLFYNSPELSEIGTKEEYSEYLKTIFPDSKVQDVLAHDTGSAFNGVIPFTDSWMYDTSVRITGTGGNYGLVSGEGFYMYKPDGKQWDNNAAVTGLMKVDMRNPLYSNSAEYTSINGDTYYEKMSDITGTPLQANPDDFYMLNDFDVLEEPPVVTINSIVKKEIGYDGFINEVRPGLIEYVGWTSEQVHILGSKKDIDGFKKYKGHKSSKLTLNQENKTLLIPAKDSNTYENDFRDGFVPKSEFHLTVFGFPQGKQLKKWLETDTDARMSKLQSLIDEADFSYTEKDALYRIERDREAWIDWQDQSKGKETLHEEAVIQLVEAPGIEAFINKVNSELGFDFPVPFPHISLATKGTKFGIGIADKKAFDSLDKELVAGEDTDFELGSTANSAEAKWDQYDRIEKNVHGDIKAMKELLRELHELGGRKEDEAHVQELEALFDDMQPEFFKKATTYIQEVTKEASGIATATNIGVKVSKKPRSYANQQSEAEVYAHEIIHSMIAFAKRAGDLTAHKLNQQVEHIVDLALESTTWKDFLPDPEDSIDQELEEKAAKEMFEYIFYSKHASEEFLAHALTNPIVSKHFKTIKMVERNKPTTLFGKVREVFLTIMEILSGDYDFRNRGENVQEQAKILAMELGEINNSNVRKMKNKINLPMRLWQILQTGNDVTSEFLENTFNKLVDKKEFTPVPDDTWGKAVWMAKAITKMLFNGEYRKSLALILSGYGLDPRGDIQTILRDFVQSDDTEQSLDMLAALSDKIDNAKVTLSGHVVTMIKDGFSKELTTDEETALTRILIDTDMSSIYEQFNDNTLAKLLRSEEEIKRRISRKTEELKNKDEKRYFWNKNQAFGLGYYMATGKAHIAQNLNADNIASGLMSEHQQKPNKDVVKLIDEIATLTALQYTHGSDKAIVANLIKNKQRAGINNIMAMHKQFKKEASEKVFKFNKINIIKGYSRELYDDQISMAIAPVEDQAQMEQEGYTLKAELPYNKYNKTGKKMAMYVADSYETGEYYRNATRLTSTKRKGTTVKDIMVKNSADDFERNKAEAVNELIERDSRKLAARLENNDVDLKDLDYGMTPVLDGDGEIMDFRFMMTKEHKIKDMGQNQKVSEVMANSFAHTHDKAESEIQNKKVLNMVLEDMKENYTHGNLIGKNMKEYVVISKKSSDKEVQELVQLLPPMFRQAMNENKYGEIAVRADLFHSYFGYRHLSILDNKYIKKLTPKVMHRFIKIAEKMWQEFIKISKIDILIKMPIVMVGNVISNVFYAIMTGTDPITLIKEYITSIRDVSQYFNRHSELVELELAQKTGNLKKRDLRRIEVLKRQLANSSIHELAELGIYQSIVEDMDTKDTESKNKLKKRLDEKMKGMPSIVREGANWLYLTEGTMYYNFMNQVLTKSDLIARDIENKKLKRIQDKQANGTMALPRWYVMKGREHIQGAKYTKTTKRLTGKEREDFMKEADKRRHNAVLNAFVNYNKPSGRVEEYLNKMGLIMFTKYAKRIQKVIAEGSFKHPLNALAIVAGEEFIYGDVETIFDQQLLTKSWYSLGLTDSDYIPGTNPFTRVMEVLNPPLVQLLT